MRFPSSSALLLLVLLAPAPPVRADGYVPGRVIVKVVPALDAPGRLDRLHRHYHLAHARPVRRVDDAAPSPAARRSAEAARWNGLFRRRGAAPATAGPSFASTYALDFDVPPGTDMRDVAAAYARDPAVAWAQPDWIRRATVVPNDPFFGTSGSWGQGFGDLWGLARVAAPAAWDLTRGAGVVIAVSDTGIDTTHPDLVQNLWTNPGEVPGNGIDDDVNGYVDDVHGWNFVANDADVDDDHGHGTHVAGTAAAAGQNGLGVVGVAFEARVMAVKGLGADGNGSDSDLADGILYAVENGARVINASWGADSPASPVLEDALDVAHAAGVVFVAAAGNSGSEVDYTPFTRVDPQQRFFPAAFRQAIAVGAVDHTDARAAFSNYGVKIDVVAPGGGDQPPPNQFPQQSILSLKARHAGAAMTGDGDLVVGGSYLRQAGTSMATPHVSGAAALVLARHPEFVAEQVRQALRHGADDVGAPGFDLSSGYGRLNAAGALGVAAPLVAHIASPMNHRSFTGDTIDVTGSAFGAGFASYTLEYATAATPDTWIVAAGPVTSEVLDGALGSVSIAGVGDTELQVRLRVTSTTGDVFEDRVLEFLDRINLTGPPAYSRWRDGTIEVTGTVAPADLQSYAVEWGEIRPGTTQVWRSDGVTLAGGGTAPVHDGVLATVDLGALPDPVRFDLRLRVTTSAGVTTETIANQIRDTSVRPGWPRQFVTNPELRFGVLGQSTPTLADLDGDGTTEILLGLTRDPPDQVLVLEPDGSDRPGWPQDVPYLRGGVSAADLDGDGLMEVVATAKDKLYVFRHDGTLLPGWPRSFVDVRGADCAIADVDGDGTPEIVFRNGRHPTIGAHVNAVHVDGSSLPGFPVDLDTEAITEVGDLLAVGDVDGDGAADIAVVIEELVRGQYNYRDGLFLPLANRSRVSLVVLDGQGRVKPGWPKKIGKEIVSDPWDKQVWTVPLLADVDGDGVLDVVAATSRLGRLIAYRGDGRKTRDRIRMALPPVHRVKKDDRHDPLIAADVTGDGVPEIVVSTDAGQDTNFGFPHDALDFIGVLEREASWSTAPGWPLQFRYQGSVPKRHGPGSVSVADIDGDGAQELVLGLEHCDGWRLGPFYCDGLWAFEADGSVVPGFPKPTHAPATPLSQPAIGDLDGDGLQEIVWVGESGEVLVWNVPGTPGPSHHEWPMVRQDAAHHGALPVVR